MMVRRSPATSGAYDIKAVTDQGIHTGNRRETVHDVYGAPDDMVPSDELYHEIGVRFGYADDGTVDQICVTWPCTPSLGGLACSPR
jgi:hypothetical protein